MPNTHARAEWVRAFGFVLSASAMALVAMVDPRDQTAVWVLGLAVSTAAVVAMFSAAFVIDSGREFFAGIAGREPTVALHALADLNRIPAAPAPHRRARLIVRVFGPLSAVAGLAVIVRLASL